MRSFRLLGLLLALSGSILALEPVPLENGVLLLRGSFDEGDHQMVRRALSHRGRFREVWLHSGGGVSTEGFLVGRVLREMQATVRIPAKAVCASACTVAFMGGYFRYIDLDAGATYHVHSASQWANGFACPKERPQCRDAVFLAELLTNTREALLRYARDEQRHGRFTARRRLVHFQRALLIPLGLEESELNRFASENDSEIEYWASRVDLPPLSYAEDQLKADIERIQAEGEPAAQDIVMRIERDSLAAGIRDLRRILPSLGPRAGHALRMIEVMWQTSILETAILTKETLIGMGFVTKEFTPK